MNAKSNAATALTSPVEMPEESENVGAVASGANAVPIGTSAGVSGRVVAVVRPGGEVLLAEDVDGVRLWLLVREGGDLGDAVRETRRRVRAARGADRAVPRSASTNAQNPVASDAVPGAQSLSPDAYVDQRSKLLDKAVFLRLARERAFPSRKIGKRVIARWGDVQAALAPKVQAPEPAKARRGATDDGLDEMRHRLGLATRGPR